MIYVIGNKKFSVAVDSFGAELNSIKKHGQEMLWQNYDGSWDAHSPILFPFCGHCAVKIGGKIYPAPPHGIVSFREFYLVSQTETELVLKTDSDAESKKLYPFDFALTVQYSVRATTLYIEYEIKNTGKGNMYFGCGGHESFNTGTALENCFIEFEKEETLNRLFHTEDGYLTGESIVYPKSKFLYFKDMPLINDETLIFTNIKSKWCKLVKKTGETIAQSYFKGFKNILFWRPIGAKTVCIEPWSNLPDLTDENIDFRDKKGINVLCSGNNTVIKRKIKY